jgi:hypothetical protein
MSRGNSTRIHHGLEKATDRRLMPPELHDLGCDFHLLVLVGGFGVALLVRLGQKAELQVAYSTIK